MTVLNFIIVKILIFLVIFEGTWTKPSPFKKWSENGSKLIVISMDGLMPSQVQPDSMPFISKLYENGVFCSKLQSVFPTKTLVNHFSIATGMYIKYNEWPIFLFTMK